MTRGERVAAAARGAVGTRFRLHGRSVADGLDCVGLAALALGAGGFAGAVPTGYPLRSGDAERLAGLVESLGLRRVRKLRPGDVIAMASGPGQLHLGIVTDIGFVHADAGLRRVVERPGVPPWPVVGRWRLMLTRSPRPCVSTALDTNGGGLASRPIDKTRGTAWRR